MNTNQLNKHLEDKSLSDITKMVDKITGILNKYDKEYDIRLEDFYLLKVQKGDNVLYQNEHLKDYGLRQILRNLLKNRYYDVILKKRTQNLLKKVELLD
tara:strand:+ start:65 stop:361 length:297 start_codon:yes stop_codon:yes gene_type:complete